MEPIFGIMDTTLDQIVPSGTFNERLYGEALTISLESFKEHGDAMHNPDMMANAAYNFLTFYTMGEFLKAGNRVSDFTGLALDRVYYPLKDYPEVHYKFPTSRLFPICKGMIPQEGGDFFTGLQVLNQLDCCIGVKDIASSVEHFISQEDDFTMKYLVKVTKPDNIFTADMLRELVPESQLL